MVCALGLSLSIFLVGVAASSYVLYQLTGHGESSLESDFTETLDNSGVTMQDLNLLTTDTVPEDAAALLINDPQADLSTLDAAAIKTYLENGGKVLLTTSGYTETPNLDAVMAQFGLAREPGLVVEGDAGHALYGYPYSLFPDYAAADESTALDGVNQSTHVMLSVAQGITITETDDVTAEPLLYTTEDAYSKQDFDASSSSAKEAGDTDGPFSLAVVWERIAHERNFSLSCLANLGGGQRCGVAWNTLLLATLTASGCTLLGLAFALIVTRTDFAAKKFLRVLTVLPIITPPFVIGLGLILLVGLLTFIATRTAQAPTTDAPA